METSVFLAVPSSVADPGIFVTEPNYFKSSSIFFVLVFLTVCPKSSDLFHIVLLVYKMGNYFLDIQYNIIYPDSEENIHLVG